MKKCAVCAQPSDTWAHVKCIMILQALIYKPKVEESIAVSERIKDA